MVRQTSELPAQRRCEVLLLDTNGYPAGLDAKIPGRIVCDSTFDSYSRKILKITRQSVMILQINELSFYFFLLALSKPDLNKWPDNCPKHAAEQICLDWIRCPR